MAHRVPVDRCRAERNVRPLPGSGDVVGSAVPAAPSANPLLHAVGVVGERNGGAVDRSPGSLLGRLFGSVSDGVAISRLHDGRFLDVNDAFLAMLGYERDEVIGRTSTELDLWLFRSDRDELVRGVTEHPTTARLEIKLRRRSGEVRDVEASAHLVEVDGVPCILAIDRDVTERRLAEGALRASDTRKSAILEAALDCIITIDQTGRIEEFNPAAERMFGYTRAEALGQEMGSLLIPPAFRDSHRSGLARIRRTGQGSIIGKRIETTALRRDGTEFPVELTVTRVASDPPVFTGYLRDLTEQKVRESDRRRTEEQYRMLFEGNPGPMWAYDVETLEFLMVNDAAVAQYGYSREEFLALKITDIRPPEDVQALATHLQEGGDARPDVWRHVRKDGTVFDVEITAGPISIDGRAARLILARDVTERTRAERTRAELAAIVESSSDAIIGQTLDGVITSWNAGATRVYGYTAEEVLGRNVSLLAPPDHNDAPEVLGRLGRGDRVDQYETTRVRKDGTRLAMSLTGSPIRDESGRLVGASVIARDISEQTRAREELRRAFEAERQAVERLRSLDEMKTTFLSAVSHELRTPLTNVIGNSLTLERLGGELSEDERTLLLHAVTTNAQRLERMITDLLDVDRLKRGVFQPRRAATELQELVRRVVGECTFLEGRSVDVSSSQMVLPVDAPMVDRIVENLLANAVRHTPIGTPVSVILRRIPEGVMIAVEDRGFGVPEDLREAVFEPFRRGAEELGPRPGIGVGLSLVARFAELHGGSAWVEPRPGGGSSFRVILRDPTAPRTDGADHAPVWEGPHAPG